MLNYKALLAFCVGAVMLAVGVGQAVELKTGDGTALQLNDQGRVTGFRLGDTSLPMKGEGGFAIADFKHQPAPVNLVPNPGFEQGSKGWHLGKGQSLDTTMAHSGKVSVKLVSPGPQPASTSLEVIVPAKPNTRYRVGMWLRRHHTGVCGAYVSERNDKNQLTGKRTQVGVTIPKQDDVWLPLSWEITTQPATTRLSLRADIYRSTGTIWLDDFFIYEVNEGVYQPVTGKLTAVGGNTQFSGALPGAGLKLQATYKPEAECLRVDGVVSDTTGEDRAVGVKFALPVDLAGWQWFNDAVEHETIQAGGLYRYTYKCKTGIGQCSIYPWSALSGPQAGFSLALPLSQGPRVFVIQHDQRVPETSITFYFGLTKDAGNNPSRAPFSFVLYRHDPAWGMRSAMQRYYRLFPESFVKRPTFEGYLNYADLEQYDPANHKLVIYHRTGLPDASDFGEGYKFLFHVHGCYDFREIASNDPSKPSDKTVFGWLKQMVVAEKTHPQSYVPTIDTMAKLCYGPEGHISYIGDTRYWRAHEGYNHTDQPGWGLNFRVDEDPGVSPYLENVSRQKAEAYAKTKHRPWDATFTADAIEGYEANQAGPDYRRAHFRTTLLPLSFGYGNLQPCLSNTIWDFLHKAWWPITQQYEIAIYGNANGYEQAFTLPYVDVPMTEGDWDPRHPGRLDRFLRAMAYHKIWRYWHAWDSGGAYGDADPASVYAQFRRGLAYAIYPSVSSIQAAAADLNSYRAQFRQYVPATEELSTAGWEPVPYARATQGVIVERFGSYEQGELHFTLRNYGDKPVDTVLSLDRQALHVPAAAQLVMINILPREPEIEPGPAGDLHLHLPADGVLALWVGTRQQAAQHGFRLAAALLNKLDRLFYTEFNDANRAALAGALKLCTSGAGESGNTSLATARQLQQAITSLAGGINTKSPVDLAKLVFRTRAAVSLVPAALLNLQISGQRLLENGLRGGSSTTSWQLTNGGREALTGLRLAVLSPWSEVAANCKAAALPATMKPAGELSPGGRWLPQAELFMPANPPRSLMCYLVQVSGEAGGQAFTVDLPVDLQAGTPLGVTVLPTRAFRGHTRHLVLTVTNHLPVAGKVTLKLSSPANVKLSPAVLPCQLPAGGKVKLPVDMNLAESVAIGALRLPFTVTSQDQRFATQGSISLLVGDPVPQLHLRRLTTAPVIDGKLDDPAWQTPPAIPTLRLLSNGGAASQHTAVWAGYDNQALYVALKCDESEMNKLVAKYAERGSPLYLDDDVEIYIQPAGSDKVYQFAVNANGAQSDNFGNKADWTAAATRGANSWSVEIKVPFAALGLTGPPPAGIPWGMQFGRQEKPHNETTSWTPGHSFISKESLGEVLFAR